MREDIHHRGEGIQQFNKENNEILEDYLNRRKQGEYQTEKKGLCFFFNFSDFNGLGDLFQF